MREKRELIDILIAWDEASAWEKTCSVYQRYIFYTMSSHLQLENAYFRFQVRYLISNGLELIWHHAAQEQSRDQVRNGSLDHPTRRKSRRKCCRSSWHYVSILLLKCSATKMVNDFQTYLSNMFQIKGKNIPKFIETDCYRVCILH